tara:strand:+ start:365 stop:604 length:240 start_codon:yes stop_codon:yes gene_type:complete
MATGEIKIKVDTAAFREIVQLSCIATMCQNHSMQSGYHESSYACIRKTVRVNDSGQCECFQVRREPPSLLKSLDPNDNP